MFILIQSVLPLLNHLLKRSHLLHYGWHVDGMCSAVRLLEPAALWLRVHVVQVHGWPGRKSVHHVAGRFTERIRVASSQGWTTDHIGACNQFFFEMTRRSWAYCHSHKRIRRFDGIQHIGFSLTDLEELHIKLGLLAIVLYG